MPTAYSRFGPQRRGIAASYSRSWGLAPGVATVVGGPDFAIGENVADLTFYFEDAEFLKLRDCFLVTPQASTATTAAPQRSFEILDRAWKWALAPRVYGEWNVELPSGALYHTASPRKLVAYLFEQLGELSVDVSALPTEPRPHVLWVGARPIDEIERICGDYGCVPFLDPITDKATVAKIGVGSGPPKRKHVSRTNARAIRPAPAVVRMISGEALFQTVLALSPAPYAQEVDGSYVPANNVSYRTDQDSAAPQFQDPLQFSNVTTSFVDPATGETQLHSELAKASVYRTYAIDTPGFNTPHGRQNFPRALVPLLDQQLQQFGDVYFQLGNSNIIRSYGTNQRLYIRNGAQPSPGYDDSIPIFSIGPFTGSLVEKNTTDGGRLPAFVRGTFADERLGYQNTKKKTRFPGSVSIDLENGLVHLGAAAFMHVPAATAPGVITPFFTIAGADLDLVAAYQVKLNGVPIRYEAFRSTLVPGGVGEIFEHHEDVSLEVVEFEAASDGVGRTNRDAVDAELGYYLDAYAGRFTPSVASRVQYAGLQRFSLSGRLRSVTWSYSTTGAPQTACSWDCERSAAVVPWEERPKAEATKRVEYQERQTAARRRIYASQDAVRKSLK